MSYDKTILCLAKSRKLSGTCVAGKERSGTGFSNWIRPVSSLPTREISLEERRYENGNDPNILDIITIPMKEPCPEAHQAENHLIDPEYYWEFEGRATWPQVLGALDKVKGPLWVNESSSYNGHNDEIQEQNASKFQHSLLLIQPTDVTISVAPEGGVFAPAKRAVRASFSLNGLHYKLKVTDPVMEHRYFQGANGVFPITQCVLCVSLAEAFKGNAYKLIATIITPDRVG